MTNLPAIPGVGRGPVLWASIGVAAVAAAGGVSGAYLGSRDKSDNEIKPQYELWTPNSMNQQAQGLVVFKHEKHTGVAWILIQDSKSKRWSWESIAPPPDSAPSGALVTR
jgi:hypothetical protein